MRSHNHPKPEIFLLLLGPTADRITGRVHFLGDLISFRVLGQILSRVRLRQQRVWALSVRVIISIVWLLIMRRGRVGAGNFYLGNGSELWDLAIGHLSNWYRFQKRINCLILSDRLQILRKPTQIIISLCLRPLQTLFASQFLHDWIQIEIWLYRCFPEPVHEVWVIKKVRLQVLDIAKQLWLCVVDDVTEIFLIFGWAFFLFFRRL